MSKEIKINKYWFKELIIYFLSLINFLINWVWYRLIHGKSGMLEPVFTGSQEPTANISRNFCGQADDMMDNLE